MASCIFCDIAEGKISSKLAHQDDRVVAFHDIGPKAPTHILVIPRQHIDDLDAANAKQAELLGHLLLVAKKVAAESGLTSGYRVVINRGNDAGETVHHLHVHVLGGRKLAWPPG